MMSAQSDTLAAMLSTTATKKLEPHEPEQIRWLLSEGYSGAEIARYFEVSSGTVSLIKQGKVHANKSKRASKAFDYIGQSFNMLTVGRVLSTRKHIIVECKCKCGTVSKQRLDHVVAGRSQSCGCFKFTWRLKPTPLGIRRSWRGLIVQYGDEVCERWRQSQEAFWQDMGTRPGRGWQPRRPDPRRPFEPGNCVWVPRSAPRVSGRVVKEMINRGGEMHVDEIVNEFRVAIGYQALGRAGIYQITNRVNGNMYIGSAVNIGQRWRCHVGDLVVGKHHAPHLQHAWNKYGPSAFVFSILDECSKADLISREQSALDEISNGLGWDCLYNTCRVAGSLIGYKHGAASLAKMSAAQRARHPQSWKHPKPGLKGRKRPPEVVAKVRAANLAKGKDAWSVIIKANWEARRARCAVTGEPLSGRPVQATCMRGHEFTPENTRVNKDGKRTCRVCSNLNQKRSRERRT